jgi:RHS repeat-associated protein
MYDKYASDDITELPYRFTGKEQDAETGLYYYGARYLDPRMSRWLSGDPALGDYIPGAPINDEARKNNQNLPGQGGIFNLVNLHVYHYAGNNPVKYVDPDGEINIAITSTYKMNSKTGNQYDYMAIIKNDPKSKRIYEEGCAITAIANLTSTLGTASDPTAINSKEGYVVNGNVDWDAIATDLDLSISKGSSQFTHAMFDTQENDAENNYNTIVKVKYTDSNSPHWVGVVGKRSEGGTDYLAISPTSTSDNPSGGLGAGRLGQGWMQKSDGEIWVPVEKTTAYRIYSKPIEE